MDRALRRRARGWIGPVAIAGALASTLSFAAPTAPLSAPAPIAAVAPPLAGAWEGALQVGAARLRLLVKIQRDGARWTATLDSLDQGVTDIPVDGITFAGDGLTLTLSSLNASYQARLDGDKLTGTWKQGGAALPLELRKTTHPTVRKPRPQEPKPPLPYDELELTVDNPAGHATLACTLSRVSIDGPGPARLARGRLPAVVLLTGSGPQDRDEALMGHRPFLVLADAIARQGVAVLRCDDRGVARSTGDFQSATSLDFVDDALAELSALRARPDVDPGRVGLVGHSEGALIAAIAAARSKDVAFVVLLAGTGLPGEEILYAQGALLAKLAGHGDAEIAKDQAVQRKLFAIVKAEKDPAVARRKLRALFDALPAAERAQSEREGGSFDSQVKPLLSPWMRVFLTLDPRPFLARLTVPVLALGGERDMQVPPQANLAEIRKALHGNPDATVRELPGLNHLFQTSQTGAVTEYAKIEETMSPAVLTLVSAWIADHARRAPREVAPRGAPP